MIMYKLIKNLQGQEVMVQRLSDNAYIPFNSDNMDYQAYLLWVSEGNVPTPADGE